MGLQHIHCTQSLREEIFKILTEVVAPSKQEGDNAKTVSLDKGRPGMDQWAIPVLGTLRLALNADYDRILELANQHKTLRDMLGHSGFDSDFNYRLQTSIIHFCSRKQLHYNSGLPNA